MNNALPSAQHVPKLRDGDVVVQTSTSNQSPAIMMATTSRVTHIGIIKTYKHHNVVIEAVGTVRETPLHEWIDRGLLNRIAIYRHRDVTNATAKHIVAAAQQY